MTLDQIVMDDDYTECHRLLNTSGISELYQVTDVKGQYNSITSLEHLSST